MRHMLSHLSLCSLAFFLIACAPTNQSRPETPVQEKEMLTLDSIFGEWEFRAREPGPIRWLDDGSGYTALETAPDYEERETERDEEGDVIEPPQDIVAYDAETLERRVLVSASQLIPEGSETPLTIDDYHWSEDLSQLLIYTNSVRVWRSKSRGDYWVLNRDSGSLWQLGPEGSPESSLQFAKFSPVGDRVAFVQHDNIYVQDLDTRIVSPLTTDASETVINGLFDWVYEEEFQIRDGFRWSPDGSRIAFWQLDTSASRDFLLINNTDTLYPVVTRFPYPKVGEDNPTARIGVVNADTAMVVWAGLPDTGEDMYIPRMDWANRSDQVLVQHMNRRQNINTVFAVDASSGEAQVVLVEQENEFIERVFDPVWLEQADAFTWISERSGWRHIYRISADGSTVIDLTPGDFDIAEMGSIDEEGGWIYFTASTENVAQRYLYRSRLDGSGEMERVTPEEFSGTNEYQMSPDGGWAIHTHSSFNRPPQTRLVSLPEHRVRNVIEDNQPLIDALDRLHLGDHEFFQVTARDEWVLDGYMIRPPDFDPGKQYPIINFVYGEPWGQTARDRWGGDRHMWHLMMTQKGFIVATVDNRGTPALKGRTWRKSIYGAVGVPASRDQSDALTRMINRWSFIDPERVGIWGHSGGGSMTLNMLFRYPGQYHAGVSIAPVPDQRLYDTIYQERYSGLLDEYEEAYRENSPIHFASQLQAELLLVHGTGDDNVHYQGTERLVNELIEYNKQFRFMAYPNRTHSLRTGEGTQLHLYTMQTRFFMETLQSAREP